MRESVEFVIPEEHIAQYLAEELGAERTQGVRKVIVDSSEPLFHKIGALEKAFRAENKCFYYGGVSRRHYTKAEIDAAELFHVWPKRVFEPSGEECGTTYDDSRGCPECGAGAPQTSQLYMDEKRIPRNVDFAQTTAREIVISARAVETLRQAEVRGAEYAPVLLAGTKQQRSSAYYQLQVPESTVGVHETTRFGGYRFDESTYGRCSRGDVLGLNILSELTVKRATLGLADLMQTKEYFGAHVGVLRPQRMMILMPRALRVIQDAGLKGLLIEVAYAK